MQMKTEAGKKKIWPVFSIFGISHCHVTFMLDERSLGLDECPSPFFLQDL